MLWARLIVLLSMIFSVQLSAVTIDERLRKLEIGQARIEAKFEARFDAINQRFDAVDKRFDALNQRISDLYLVVVSLMIGIFGFSAYLAYDRRKLNKIIIEIEQGIYENKRLNKEHDKKFEGLTEALKKIAKKDKTLANILHKFGLM